jgi:hypothetical protein
MNYSLFGTAECPLRCSLLPLLIRCPMSVALRMAAESDAGSEAAHTGSAVHAAANAYHTIASGNARLAIGIMRELLPQYPLADLDAAEQHFLRYAGDPRNREAEIILSEAKVQISLPCAEEDQTGEAIVINGTLDQVRREGSVLTLWDIKTGKRLQGDSMLTEHALQLAAYQIGATQLLGERVQSVGIIRTQDYLSRTPGPVFWHAAWSYRHALMMLDSIRRIVASIRGRGPWVGPGEDCRWCPGGGVPSCLEIDLAKLG